MATGIIASTAPVSAQVLYNNLVTPSIDSRNDAPAYLKFGDGFVIQSTRVDGGDTINTLVTQMMSDELKLEGNSLADVIVRQVAVSVVNANVDLAMTVRPHIRIYDDNHLTPTPPYPDNSPNPPNNDSPGTLLYSLDLGPITIGGATADTVSPIRDIAGSAILNVDSTQFGALNLPMSPTKYWFGIFFDIDEVAGVDLATQKLRLGQLGLGLYNPPTVGFSADVHHETDRYATGDANGNGTIEPGEAGFPNYQRNYFNTSFATDDPNGVYVKASVLTGQPILSNFGWLVGGVIVPEPSAAAFALLGIPAFALIARRRKS